MRVRQFDSRQSFEIDFRYKGHRLRAILKGLDPKVSSHHKAAERIEAGIRSDIALGTIDLDRYEQYFAITKKMRQVFGLGRDMTFRELLEGYLADIERSREHSTHMAYRKASDAYLLPRFGSHRVKDLTPEMFRSMVRGLDIKIKSIRNILTPARGALERAVADGQIPFNPIDGVKLNYLTTKSQKARPVKDPFLLDEISAILTAAADNSPRFHNLIQFGFYTGLRESELMALEWGDLDGERVHICRAHVMRKEKGTKTESGNRWVDLLPMAAEALRRQKQFTFWRKGRIFCRHNRNLPLTDYQQVQGKWSTILKLADVRYRPPNQMRHTFISHMLSSGVNRWYLIEQVGHRDDSSLKEYASWVDQWKDQSGQYGAISA